MPTSGRERAGAGSARCQWVCGFGVWITRGQQGQILHRIPVRYGIPAPPGEGAKLCLCFCQLGRAGLAPWDRSSPGSSQQYPGNTSTPHTCACGTRIPLPGEGRIALLPARRGAAGRWDWDCTDLTSWVKIPGMNKATVPSSSRKTVPKGQQEARSAAPP